MKYRYDKGAHAVYSIQFHLVFCVKYRRKVLKGPVVERLKEIVHHIAERFGVEIIEQETVLDHIHILFAGKPQLQVSKFVNSLKGVSSRLLRKEFPELREHLWGNHFWSPSYFIASTGRVTLDVLRRYVEEQCCEAPSKIKKEDKGPEGKKDKADRE
ncbi:transposase and inactivated derivatives [Pelotomaculum thermopropionicum SI]|uniref:Transposase and inactivated derivatives n=1 Tax=Pelotomaculum thermopropionicum (strain DSM 13744 / JCM 10971 / SI) TaxID=370438 RepID=A5CZ87_PELTS|nr:transposase and inactivated derivatives [Pelotomaculum thermopropionicum SI]